MLALPLGGAQAEDLTRKQRTAAKKIYDSKCAKCHRFYEPREYAQEEWQLWMTKMSRKAKLNPSQDKLLNRYLDAYRAQKAPLTITGSPSRRVGPVIETAKGQQSSGSIPQKDSSQARKGPGP